MAMTFEFNIRPFGYQNDPIEFGRMRGHSAGASHEYAIDYKAEDGWKTIRGTVPKMIDGVKRSGHRNFLHLLADIMADIELKDLGRDYVNIMAEVESMYPGTKASDYKEKSNVDKEG